MAYVTQDLGRESYWRVVIGRWRRSGQSAPMFCRAEGIREPSFYGWRRKLEPANQPKPAFLPVHLVANQADQPATQVIEVVLINGRTLRVLPGFDPHTLMTLVEVLEGGETSC